MTSVFRDETVQSALTAFEDRIDTAEDPVDRAVLELQREGYTVLHDYMEALAAEHSGEFHAYNRETGTLSYRVDQPADGRFDERTPIMETYFSYTAGLFPRSNREQSTAHEELPILVLSYDPEVFSPAEIEEVEENISRLLPEPVNDAVAPAYILCSPFQE